MATDDVDLIVHQVHTIVNGREIIVCICRLVHSDVCVVYGGDILRWDVDIGGKGKLACRQRCFGITMKRDVLADVVNGPSYARYNVCREE